MTSPIEVVPNIQITSLSTVNKGGILFPKWEFLRKKDLGMRNIDPAEDYFFEELPPLGAVIRESTQNSLDASKDNSPVKMRISVKSGKNGMPLEIAKKYFQNLFPHLGKSGIKIPTENKPMDYVVIEDFGTVGLSGDAGYFGLGDDAQDNRFYWFHRNTNRTTGETARGGSYGYGKYAFANASRIKTFFSVSKDENGIKIFGNSIGKTHEMNGNTYLPYGDFGRLTDFGSRGEAVMPSQSEELAKTICSDFGLNRLSGCGLSVIIPYPEKIYTDNEIIESMIRAYFLPICQGKLEIEIASTHEISITKDTIAKICDRQSWAKKPAGAMATTNRKCMNGLVGLASWWHSNPITTQLNSPSERALVWTRDLIPEENYDTLRNRLDSGKPIALCVSLPIYRLGENKRKERYPTDSSFTILLRKDQSYGRSDAIWIRRYLSVPKTAYVPIKSGFISIIISEDGILEELLRKSEEVAHTQHRSTRIKDQYHSPRDIVEFYRKSAQYIIELLQIKEETFEKDWIDDWFPSEEVDEKNPSKRKRRKRKKRLPDEDISDDEVIVGPPPPPEDLSDNHSWDLDKIAGGFSVSGEIKHGVDYVFTIKMGYSRDDGTDPIKKWKKFDFDAKDLTVELSGVVVEKQTDNVMVVRAKGPIEEYFIDVRGFDPARDLSVHCKPKLHRGETNDE